MNTPRKIEWSGPESWTVWADEDGVHVRTPKGDALEMPDVRALLNLWTEACSDVQSGQIPAPKPPTREEVRGMTSPRAMEYAKRRDLRASLSVFNTTDAPF